MQQEGAGKAKRLSLVVINEASKDQHGVHEEELELKQRGRGLIL